MLDLPRQVSWWLVGHGMQAGQAPTVHRRRCETITVDVSSIATAGVVADLLLVCSP